MRGILARWFAFGSGAAAVAAVGGVFVGDRIAPALTVLQTVVSWPAVVAVLVASILKIYPDEIRKILSHGKLDLPMGVSVQSPVVVAQLTSAPLAPPGQADAEVPESDTTTAQRGQSDAVNLVAAHYAAYFWWAAWLDRILSPVVKRVLVWLYDRVDVDYGEFESHWHSRIPEAHTRLFVWDSATTVPGLVDVKDGKYTLSPRGRFFASWLTENAEQSDRWEKAFDKNRGVL